MELADDAIQRISDALYRYALLIEPCQRYGLARAAAQIDVEGVCSAQPLPYAHAAQTDIRGVMLSAGVGASADRDTDAVKLDVTAAQVLKQLEAVTFRLGQRETAELLTGAGDNLARQRIGLEGEAQRCESSSQGGAVSTAHPRQNQVLVGAGAQGAVAVLARQN